MVLQIETPAAALGVITIARHVDFLSVGTTDLAQYTLAAGRDDPAVSHYYDDTHAAVLRRLAIAIADAPGVPIALCGELAGREETMPQLLRLGFRSLSMAPGLIPGAKELIRSVHLGDRQAKPAVTHETDSIAHADGSVEREDSTAVAGSGRASARQM